MEETKEEMLLKEPLKDIQTITISEGQPLVPKDFKSQLTRKQVEVIKEQFAKGATDMELQMFLYVCQRTGLDPFSRQIHLVPRWDSRLGKEVRGVIIGIDGLRSVAERTGAYAGNTDPIFEGETDIEVKKTDYKTKDTKTTKVTVPSRATVTVKKVVQGVICDFTATSEWTEYYPGDKQGMMWIKMPKNMLGKTAEAKALRKAFPSVMSGLYVAEEMQQAIATAVPEKVQTDFDKAISMIGNMTNLEALEGLTDKISTSKKYTAKEKETILGAVNMRTLEIEPRKVVKEVKKAKVAEEEPLPEEN